MIEKTVKIIVLFNVELPANKLIQCIIQKSQHTLFCQWLTSYYHKDVEPTDHMIMVESHH